MSNNAKTSQAFLRPVEDRQEMGKASENLLTLTLLSLFFYKHNSGSCFLSAA